MNNNTNQNSLLVLAKSLVEAFDEISESFNSLEEKLNIFNDNVEEKINLKAKIGNTKSQINSVRKKVAGIEKYHDQLTDIQDLFSEGINRQIETSSKESNEVVRETSKKVNEGINSVISSAKKSERNTLILAIFGIVVSLIGLLATLYYSNTNSGQFAEETKRITKQIVENTGSSPEKRGGFTKEDLLRLETSKNINEINQLKEMFSQSLPSQSKEKDDIYYRLISQLNDAERPEVKLLVASYFYSIGDLEHSKDKLLEIKDTKNKIINDKNWLLSEIYLQNEEFHKISSVHKISENQSWLGIKNEILKATISKIANIQKQKLKIVVIDASAGKGDKRTSEGEKVSEILKHCGWTNTTVNSFDYKKYQPQVSRGLASQYQNFNFSDDLEKRLKKDIEKIGFANSIEQSFYKVHNPKTMNALKKDYKADALIIIGVEFGGSYQSIMSSVRFKNKYKK